MIAPITLTEEERDLARYALGLPNPFRVAYRNSFVTGPSYKSFAPWLAMVAKGAALRSHKKEWIPGRRTRFYLTKEGISAALEEGESLDPTEFTE